MKEGRFVSDIEIYILQPIKRRGLLLLCVSNRHQ